jgi:hypothetical protein
MRRMLPRRCSPESDRRIFIVSPLSGFDMNILFGFRKIGFTGKNLGVMSMKNAAELVKTPNRRKQPL